MSQSEAREWWADVQHVRESIERRRAADRRDAPGGRRRPEHYAPRWADSDWADDLNEPRRRFARDGEGPADLAPDAIGADDDRVAPEPAPRRTIQITGRTAPAPELRRPERGAHRRPPRRPGERVGRRPDRVALWAVGLAFFLILVAATSSSQAATGGWDEFDSAPALIAPASSR